VGVRAHDCFVYTAAVFRNRFPWRVYVERSNGSVEHWGMGTYLARNKLDGEVGDCGEKCPRVRARVETGVHTKWLDLEKVFPFLKNNV
jgi:hypothetical protein